MMNGWPLKQIDVNNAFLHGTLKETVYMLQPLGFKYLHNPNYVCRLCKMIYGLKQALTARYSTLKYFILALGLHTSRVDPSLFIYHCDLVTYYLLVYVDDPVLTENDQGLVAHVVL